MEPDEPVYDCLNLQLKGCDFALLESAQRQIHRYAEVMGLQVDEWLVLYLSDNVSTKKIKTNLQIHIQ